EVARRCGAEVERVEVAWGEPIPLEWLQAGILAHKPDLVAVVHAETSTGVLQPLDGIAAAVHEAEALLLVDAVTSLGGMPVDIDANGVDICYSGTQKCLSAPPGLAPITFSEAATVRFNERVHAVQSWYLDMTMIGKYWGTERVYHHTAPISALYGL